MVLSWMMTMMAMAVCVLVRKTGTAPANNELEAVEVEFDTILAKEVINYIEGQLTQIIDYKAENYLKERVEERNNAG